METIALTYIIASRISLTLKMAIQGLVSLSTILFLRRRRRWRRHFPFVCTSSSKQIYPVSIQSDVLAGEVSNRLGLSPGSLSVFFRCPPRSFVILLFDLTCFSAVCAGVCSPSRDTCPYQDSRFFLTVSDQFVCFVLIISSSFMIICGHFMFMIFLMRFLWKVSIFFPLFLVNVHSSLLYRNIDATYALKALVRVLRLTLFYFRIFSFFLKVFIACPFLLLMSCSVSRRLPSNLHCLYYSAPIKCQQKVLALFLMKIN